MKIFYLIAIFSLLAGNLGRIQAADEAQKSQSDAEIRQKIVGTWIIDEVTSNGTYSAKGTITYASDSNYVAKATVVEGGRTRNVKYEGMWQVENGILTDTITYAIGIEGTPAKNFEHCKIICVNDQELVRYLGTKPSKFITTEKRTK
jgi:hypothetical protein